MTQTTSRGRRPAPTSPNPLLSFALRARVVASIGNVQYDALQASFEEVVGARGLRVDGKWAPEPSFVMHRDGHAVDDADRRAVAVWAAARRELIDYTVGPLMHAPSPG